MYTCDTKLNTRIFTTSPYNVHSSLRHHNHTAYIPNFFFFLIRLSCDFISRLRCYFASNSASENSIRPQIASIVFFRIKIGDRLFFSFLLHQDNRQSVPWFHALYCLAHAHHSSLLLLHCNSADVLEPTPSILIERRKTTTTTTDVVKTAGDDAALLRYEQSYLYMRVLKIFLFPISSKLHISWICHFFFFFFFLSSVMRNVFVWPVRLA